VNTIIEKPMVERWGMQLNASLNELEKTQGLDYVCNLLQKEDNKLVLGGIF